MNFLPSLALMNALTLRGRKQVGVPPPGGLPGNGLPGMGMVGMGAFKQTGMNPPGMVGGVVQNDPRMMGMSRNLRRFFR